MLLSRHELAVMEFDADKGPSLSVKRNLGNQVQGMEFTISPDYFPFTALTLCPFFRATLCVFVNREPPILLRRVKSEPDFKICADINAEQALSKSNLLLDFTLFEVEEKTSSTPVEMSLWKHIIEAKERRIRVRIYRKNRNLDTVVYGSHLRQM
jgi:hypothetical protein